MAFERVNYTPAASPTPPTIGNGNDRVINNPSNGNGIGTSRSVERVARKLVDIFSSPESWRFYCLASNELTEHRIDQLVAEAVKYGRDPAKLFNHLVRKELAKQGTTP